ncbi:MAG: SDR family oxidoreductase [Kiritimatiellae bacterium]|nr:SDR family oxidoreductase [Kiritimatiellia bacterium]
MRSVLVTGGTTRLGLAIAERLRADGWRVIASSHRADSGADIVADLSEPLGAAKLYAACLRLLGGNPPDVLVNNAALFAGDDAALEAVNLVAPQKLTMLMAGRETGRGAVVNILDCRVLCGAEGEGAYFRTKRALLDYTMKSAAMFAETLRVNAVAPGPVLAPTEVHEKAGETPFGRPAPEDVASAVSFLLSARATGGCVVPVDGGQSLF